MIKVGDRVRIVGDTALWDKEAMACIGKIGYVVSIRENGILFPDRRYVVDIQGEKHRHHYLLNLSEFKTLKGEQLLFSFME